MNKETCKCEQLKDVPKNEKYALLLQKRESHDSDYDQVMMVLNHHEDEECTPYAFIVHKLKIKSTGRCYDTVIPITNCPYCGRNLLESEGE